MSAVLLEMISNFCHNYKIRKILYAHEVICKLGGRCLYCSGSVDIKATKWVLVRQ
jgi:hypothetical protein